MSFTLALPRERKCKQSSAKRRWVQTIQQIWRMSSMLYKTAVNWNTGINHQEIMDLIILRWGIMLLILFKFEYEFFLFWCLPKLISFIYENMIFINNFRKFSCSLILLDFIEWGKLGRGKTKLRDIFTWLYQYMLIGRTLSYREVKNLVNLRWITIRVTVNKHVWNDYLEVNWDIFDLWHKLH